jgi:flagellar basal body-associated protein FliL
MANVTHWRKKGNKADAATIFLGLVLLTMAGTVGCQKSPPAPSSIGNDSMGATDKGVLHLEPFVVNLADPEENRFLRVGIDLGLKKPLPGKEGKGGEGDVPAARIRDCILYVLSTWRSDSLLATDGKQKLKDEILRALQDRVPELGVKEVYFTDFLVQR